MLSNADIGGQSAGQHAKHLLPLCRKLKPHVPSPLEVVAHNVLVTAVPTVQGSADGNHVSPTKDTSPVDVAAVMPLLPPVSGDQALLTKYVNTLA